MSSLRGFSLIEDNRSVLSAPCTSAPRHNARYSEKKCLIERPHLIVPLGCSHQSSRRRPAVLQATKKAVDEWGALASGDGPDEDDPDFIAYINDVSNKALRVMLDGDIQKSLKLKDELNELGAALVQQKNFMAGKFVFVLITMLNHKMDTTIQLSGRYQLAFDKMFALLEDSGYALIASEDEDEDEESGDGPVLPSVGLYNK